MAIVFGSPEARAVLRKDFQRRNGHIEIRPLTNVAGVKIDPPAHYVAGDWRDAYPSVTEGEEEWVDLADVEGMGAA